MIVIRIVLLAAAVAAAGAEYCYSTDENPYRLYATKTAYDDVRNTDEPQSEAPPG